MFIVTRTKTTAERVDGTLCAVKRLDNVHTEENVDDMLEKHRLGDSRLEGVRIWELDISDDGIPFVGKELTT